MNDTYTYGEKPTPTSFWSCAIALVLIAADWVCKPFRK